MSPCLMCSTPSLSVPFVPPAKEYMPLETQVERFPNWGYQLFFQEESTNVAIEKQVRKGGDFACACCSYAWHVSSPDSSG